MIQLKLTIEEIDYDSVAEFLAPAFADQTANGNIPAWARLLLVGGGATGDTIRKMLSKVPDSTKEDMIVQAVNFRTERTAERSAPFRDSSAIMASPDGPASHMLMKRTDCPRFRQFSATFRATPPLKVSTVPGFLPTGS